MSEENKSVSDIVAKALEAYAKETAKLDAEAKKEEVKSEDKGIEIAETAKTVSHNVRDYMSVKGLVSGVELKDLNVEEKDSSNLIVADLLFALKEKDSVWLANYKRKVQPQVEGTNALGGYLVPTAFSNEVERKAVSMETIFPRARKFPLRGLSVNMPTQDSSPKFTLTSESGLKSSTSVQFGQVTLTAYKYAGINISSDELLADASVDMIPYITELFGNSLAELRDDVFVNGTGSGQPAGIDSYTFTTVDAGGALTGDHLISAIYRIHPSYAANAVWLMHSRVAEQVRQLKVNGEANNYAMTPGLNGAIGETLLGKTVLRNDAVDQDKIFLIDLSKFVVTERQPMTVDVSNQASVFGRDIFQRDETAIRVVTRIGSVMPQTEGCVEINNI